MECQLLFIHLLPFNYIFSFRDFNDLGFLDNFERIRLLAVQEKGWF